MILKIGDFVRFVDEPIEGHVTALFDNELIGVTDESGFEIPVESSKVTLVHGQIPDDEDDLVMSKADAGPFVKNGISLAIHGEQKAGIAYFELVNSTSYTLAAALYTRKDNKTSALAVEVLPAKSSRQIYQANYSGLGKWPTFVFQILRFDSVTGSVSEPISVEYKVRAVDLGNKPRKIDLIGAAGWEFVLDDEKEITGIERLKDWRG